VSDQQVFPTLEEMRAELEAVVASRYFCRAPTLVSFLRYVSEKYFSGEADKIKEYTIAVEAFGRSPDFEPKQDPIVRVDANRLRERLKKYYRTEGRDHAVHILLPTGQYVPVFQLQSRPAAGSAPDQSQLPVPATAVLPALTGSPQEHPALNLRTRPVELVIAKPRVFRIAWVGLPVALLAGMLIMVFVRPLTESTSPQVDSPPVTASQPSAGPLAEMRILCGNNSPKYADQIGRIWTADRYYVGGTPFKAAADAVIARAEDQVIWRGGRLGDFEYRIPLKPGIYEAHLYFAEPDRPTDGFEGAGETTRLFDLFINGQLVLDEFDVVADAGGTRTADVKVFTDLSPAADGFLSIRLHGTKGRALLNAIEIFPGLPGRMRTLRMTTRTIPLFARNQEVWSPDRFFSGGRRVAHATRIVQASDPELYETERFGNFTYVIPVAPGRYTAILHFAETYFGPENVGLGGPDSRKFDVQCNGLLLLKDFDIFTEAGGANRPVLRTFRNLKPNTQGKLIFSFLPIKNYACLSAIEIIPEGK